MQCDRCGGVTEPCDPLPFAQFRERTGRNPVLCSGCRHAMADWILDGVDTGGA